MKDLKVENSLMTVTEFEQNGLVRRKIVFLLMRLGGQRINLQVFILNKSFSKEKGNSVPFKFAIFLFFYVHVEVFC